MPFQGQPHQRIKHAPSIDDDMSRNLRSARSGVIHIHLATVELKPGKSGVHELLLTVAKGLSLS